MKDIFCAKCQQVTQHKGSVDPNGEFLFECQNSIPDENGMMIPCDRFVKFPADTTRETFEKALEVHQTVNAGQVSMEGQEKKLEELLGDMPQPEVSPEPAPVEDMPAQDEQTTDGQ